MRFLFVLLLIAPAAWAETCPPIAPWPESYGVLMEQIRVAPDEKTARNLSNEAWRHWVRAPDTYAQELLDTGMERRSAFDFEGAHIAFDALVNYCPDYAEGYNQRAFVAFLRGNFAPALSDLEVAIRLVPDHFAAHSGRALTLMNMGRVEEGQIALKEALALNPWLPERHMLIPDSGTDL